MVGSDGAAVSVTRQEPVAAASVLALPDDELPVTELYQSEALDAVMPENVRVLSQLRAITNTNSAFDLGIRNGIIKTVGGEIPPCRCNQKICGEWREGASST